MAALTAGITSATSIELMGRSRTGYFRFCAMPAVSAQVVAGRRPAETFAGTIGGRGGIGRYCGNWLTWPPMHYRAMLAHIEVPSNSASRHHRLTTYACEMMWPLQCNEETFAYA